MNYQQKNTTGSLVSQGLILTYFLIRVGQMLRTDTFTQENVFRLWWIVLGAMVVVTVVTTVFMHVFGAVVEAVRTQQEPEIEGIQDERDKLIDLRGDRVSYIGYSSGSFFAMLFFVLGQPSLVMFAMLLFFLLLANVAGDVYKLILYGKGM